MFTASRGRRQVIWPDVVMAGLQVPLGAVMIGYGLVVPKTVAGHVAIVGVALVVLLVGLGARRFGAGTTVAVLLDMVAFLPPIGSSGEDFPSLVYGFPFLSTGAACFALGGALMATGGDEKLGVSFLMAGTGLVILSLLVPLVRAIVKALSRSPGEGTE